MERVIPLLTLVALVAAWAWFLYKQSDGRVWSPLWLAFSTTATASLFLVSGIIGYTLSKRTRFVSGTAWSDTVVWWEIWVGLALALVATYFWRKGLRSIRHSS